VEVLDTARNLILRIEVKEDAMRATARIVSHTQSVFLRAGS
jgi:hypothetical protein